MKRPLTITSAIAAAFLVGLSCAAKPKPDGPLAPSVEAYPEYRAKVAECDSLSFALGQANEAKGLAESKLAELQAKGPQIIHEPADMTEVESLRVQLAQLQKQLAIHPEDPIDADAYDKQKKSSNCADGNCRPMSQSYLYNPRPRLFGRFRK